jgi:hypothetical protein
MDSRWTVREKGRVLFGLGRRWGRLRFCEDVGGSARFSGGAGASKGVTSAAIFSQQTQVSMEVFQFGSALQ